MKIIILINGLSLILYGLTREKLKKQSAAFTIDFKKAYYRNQEETYVNEINYRRNEIRLNSGRSEVSFNIRLLGHSKKEYTPKTYIKNGYRYYKDSNRAVHRCVMEKKIGRKLKREEVVHHEDGNKLNNNIDNLRLFKNQYEHDLYHRKNYKATGDWYGVIDREQIYQRV